jgi:hypothetical protein
MVKVKILSCRNSLLNITLKVNRHSIYTERTILAQPIILNNYHIVRGNSAESGM